MADCYYRILDIERNADEADIRRAYRKAALRWHPDKNPGDKDTSEAMFKKVAEAYEVLGDPEKRVQYDQGGNWSLMGSAWPGFGGWFGPHSMSNAFDIFEQVFHGKGFGKGKAMRKGLFKGFSKGFGKGMGTFVGKGFDWMDHHFGAEYYDASFDQSTFGQFQDQQHRPTTVLRAEAPVFVPPCAARSTTLRADAPAFDFLRVDAPEFRPSWGRRC